MKYKMLVFSAMLILMLAVSACGTAEGNENEATSTPMSGVSTSVMETPSEDATAMSTSEATTTVESTPLATETQSASTTETAVVPVTGGETLLGVSQSDTMGAYLVEQNGMTVYVSKEDTQNGSSSGCTGDCANTWLPVTISGGLNQGTPGASGTVMPGTTSMPETPGVPSATSGVGGMSSTAVAETPVVSGTAMPGTGIDPTLIGSITRDDGTVQLTYNGWPLYTYTQDVSPGDTNGQGKNDQWYLISPSGDLIEK